jgi:hypothetical protein
MSSMYDYAAQLEDSELGALALPGFAPATNYYPNSLPEPPQMIYTGLPSIASTTGGHSTRDAVLGTINNSLGLIGNIFASKNQAQQIVPVVNQVASDPNANNQSGVGISFNSQGVMLGGSLISWPILGIGAVGIYLLQSKGFSRR